MREVEVKLLDLIKNREIMILLLAAKTAMKECGADAEDDNIKQAGEEFLDI